MKIDPNFKAKLVDFKNESVNKTSDPFDLNLEITSLTNNHNNGEMAPYVTRNTVCGCITIQHCVSIQRACHV